MKQNNTHSLAFEMTLGDGNCSFNAFILGLSQPKILQGIERVLHKKGLEPDVYFIDFLSEVIKRYPDIQNWESLKKAFLKHRNDNQLQDLQRNFADIMRQLAIHRIENKLQDNADYTANLQAAMRSAYEYYLKRKLGLDDFGQEDDIFLSHAFFKNKLDEVLPKITGEDKLEGLNQHFENDFLNWWKNQGQAEFLTNMRRNGIYAGDLELAELGEYFHVNIAMPSNRKIMNNQFPANLHYIYQHCGQLPKEKFDQTQIDELVARGVINHPDPHATTLDILPLTKIEIESRLGMVPLYGQLRLNVEDMFPANGAVIKQKLSGFSESSRRQFQARNLISFNRTENAWMLSSFDSKEEVLKRMDSIPHKDEVMQVLEQHVMPLPSILLNNVNKHWSHYRVNPTNQPAIQQNNQINHASDVMGFCERHNIDQRIPKIKKAMDLLVADAKSKPYAAIDVQPSNVQHLLTYSIFNKQNQKEEKIYVTREQQIILDKQYAQKLQAEEYAGYKARLKSAKR